MVTTPYVWPSSQAIIAAASVIVTTGPSSSSWAPSRLCSPNPPQITASDWGPPQVASTSSMAAAAM